MEIDESISVEAPIDDTCYHSNDTSQIVDAENNRLISDDRKSSPNNIVADNKLLSANGTADSRKDTGKCQNCKIYFNFDGTVYVFPSDDCTAIERNLPHSCSEFSNSNCPTTVCFVRSSRDDEDLEDDAERKNTTIFTYKVSDFAASEETYANERLLLCLTCKTLISTCQAFLTHALDVHNAQLVSETRDLFLNTDSNVCAVLHNSGEDKEAIVSFLIPITSIDARKFDVEDPAPRCSDASIDASTTYPLYQPYALPNVSRCMLHPDGRSGGVDCPKCDLTLGSTRSLGGHMTMMHSRNSCKTLKCPKCNWHYKYQETLEIHMNEKHNDAPTPCVYCASNAPHPRLGRGDQWSCGYKPYRCEVCKYSTTTKGNLAIHMQSDKHLNNVQEIQQGKMCGVAAPAPAMPSTATAALALQHMNAEASTSKTKASWRCDVCNYETNVARNLRIHMTSEKHTQNLLTLHQSVKTFPANAAASAFGHRTFGEYAAPTSSASTLLTFNTPTCAEDVLASSLALNMQNLMFDSVLNDGRLLQCCICMSFACDTLPELIAHCQNVERSRPNESDVSMLSGNFVCNLCHYKTHLKANFQLHTKTDKHLQRLQLVNHVREGGAQNELRFKYMNANNPIQLRCVACNEFCNSIHKLQMHLLTNRHKSLASSYDKALTTEVPENNCLYCTLCDYEAVERRSMLVHLHSERHNDLLNQILPVIESSSDIETSNALNWVEIREKTENGLSEEFDEEEENSDEGEESTLDDKRRRTMMTLAAEGDSQKTYCLERNFNCENEKSMELHVQREQDNDDEGDGLICPLCQTVCGTSRDRLENHLTQMHKVPIDGVKRLLDLLPSTSSVDKLQSPNFVQQQSKVCNSNVNEQRHLKRSLSHSPSLDDELSSPATDDLPFANGINDLNEELVNSPSLAEAAYSDNSANHRFKCDHCRMAFTKQIYLSLHERTLQHRQKNSRRSSLQSTPLACNGGSGGGVDDKYADPNRPFKCDVCKESFTQRNILIVHYNSVSHLNKMKKIADATSSSTGSPSSAKNLPTASSSMETKLTSSAADEINAKSHKQYKCNICKVCYATGSTLDVHLRSVVHQTRMSKLYELLISGEIDINRPLIEQPADGQTSMKQNNNVQQQSIQTLLQMAAASAGDDEWSPQSNLEQTLRAAGGKGLAFRKLLENYGFEVVMQFNESHHRKRVSTSTVNENCEPSIKKIKNDNVVSENEEARLIDVPELAKCKCLHCEKEFSSLWVLKAHIEQVHKRLIPVEEVEKISEEFKTVYEKRLNDDAAASSSGKTSEAPLLHKPVNDISSQQHAADYGQVIKNKLQSNSNSSVAHQQHPASTSSAALTSQMAAMAAMSMGMQFPFMGMPFSPFGVSSFLPMMMPSGAGGFDPIAAFVSSAAQSSMNGGAKHNYSVANSSASPSAAQLLGQQQQKRARTRITDDQLKVLREYFDINNSPSEEQIEQMSRKTGLPLKVIKHWFRNTLFKERQRSKDSPYNFNIPPSLHIDLEEYEKTGEAKVISIKAENPSESGPELSRKVKVEPSLDVQTPIQADLNAASKNESPISENVEFSHSTPTNQMIPEQFDDEYDDASENEHNNSSYNNSDNVGGIVDARLASTMSAHEALRQLAAVGLSSMQMPYSMPNGAASPLSSLLGQHTALYQTSNASSDLTNLVSNVLSPGNQLNAVGRRANRTRFTEWQVRILQEFFEKNAYPKDDDLEILSGKLNLSPRVIVVWFQNARQKARKIYENLPAECDDRFVRTAGLNYQCKKCRLVFQRYYELIKHQKSACFKDEAKFDGDQSPPLTAAPAQAPFNKSPVGQQKVKSSFSTPKKDFRDNGIIGDELKCHQCNIPFTGLGQLEEHLKIHASNPMLFASSHFTADNKLSNENRQEVNADANFDENDAKVRQRSTSEAFKKRCPFCCILFHSKLTLESHLSSKHQQYASLISDVLHLPDAEEVPTITTVPLTEAIWNAAAKAAAGDSKSVAQSMLNMGVVPGTTAVQASTRKNGSDLSSIIEKLNPNKKTSNDVECPLDLSRSIKLHNANVKQELVDDQQLNTFGGASSSTNNRTPSNNSNDEDGSFMSYEENDDSQSFYSQNASPSHSPHQQQQQQLLAALARPQKRFRTRLTPQQIRVMKFFFADFKTPTMSECELLGNEMSLHKRVVQVWFQNARAKERKAKLLASDSPLGDDCKSSSATRCTFCDVPYSGRMSMQEHCFSKMHVFNLRKYVEETEDPMSNSFTPDFVDTSSSETLSIKPTPAASMPEIIEKSLSSSRTSTKSSTQPVQQQKRQISAQNATPAVSNAQQDLSSMTNAANVAQNLLPYLYAQNNPAAYYASLMMPGMGFGGMPNGNLFYDPNVHGTPLNLLQIPGNVMQLIATALQRGKDSFCRFTQDGKSAVELAKSIGGRHRAFVGEKDVEVGWACRTCLTVFQAEALFLNHQRCVCQSNDRAFKLIQTHYECKACNSFFGTQAEFIVHCDSADHKANIENC